MSQRKDETRHSIGAFRPFRDIKQLNQSDYAASFK
jgi:hypothetical protein